MESQESSLSQDKLIPRRVIDDAAIADQALEQDTVDKTGETWTEKMSCAAEQGKPYVNIYKPGTKVIFPADEYGVKLIKIVPNHSELALLNLAGAGARRYYGLMPKKGYRLTITAWIKKHVMGESIYQGKDSQ